MKRSKELNAHPHARLSASTSNLLADRVEPRRRTDWSSTFRRHLLKWFHEHGRNLPWRGISDPYAIWISEIMLQQTQVVTVIPYYQRFLQRFPTVADLAAADEQDVFRLWEGLGYYRRGDNFTRQPDGLRRNTAIGFRAIFRLRCACPVSVGTRLGQFFRSRLICDCQSWKPTPCVSGRGCSRTEATRSAAQGKRCSGRQPSLCCPDAAAVN